jgi:hypothetical protein
MMKLSQSILCCLLLCIIASTTSFALGIAPSRIISEFTTDVHQEFNFKIINSEHSSFDVLVYPRGELAKYITVEKNRIHVSEEQYEIPVRYAVDIPYAVHRPGTNLAEIVVEETASEYAGTTAVGGRVAVVHQLLLESPHKGSYAHITFSANNPDFDQDLNFVYALANEGAEDIPAFMVRVDVFDTQYNLVGTQENTVSGLAVGQNTKQSLQFTRKLNPGEYYAKTTVRYNDEVYEETILFIVGRPHIVIEGIGSEDFELGEINELITSLYNPWFRDIHDVVTEFIVRDSYGTTYGTFKAAPETIAPFSGKTVAAYWNTENIPAGVYKLLVRAYYDQRVTDREFEILVSSNKLTIQDSPITGSAITARPQSRDTLITVLVVVFIVLMIVNILLVIYIRRSKNTQ